MAGLKRTGEQKGFNRDVIVWMLKPRQMFEGTTKNVHTQGVLRFFLHMSEKNCTFAGALTP